MNHHHHHQEHPPQPPPPPPPINHQTTTEIFKQTTKIFTTHIITFIFLISLIFTFRSNVEHGSRYLSSFIDRDPSIKSLLSRVDLRSPYPHHGHHHHHLHRRRRRPFLHLTRVGTLDDDFFSGDPDLDRSLFNPVSKPSPNASFLTLYNFDPSVFDNGISFPQIIRNGAVSFQTPPEVFETIQQTNNTFSDDHDDNSTVTDSGNDTVDAKVVDLRFLITGLRLGGQDAAALFYLVGILSAAYGYVILAFLVTYTWVYGIVFLKVLDHLLGKHRSIFRTVWDGSGLGLRRLAGFVLMRWAVRDALAQLVGIWFFGEVDDQYSFFKIFVRMKLMPFSDVAPWVKGYERESVGFILAWFFVEMMVGFLFAVDSWVVAVDARKSGREVMKEGCKLLATMLFPSLELKCWEAMACGTFTRWIMRETVGELFALGFQSVMEIYFMVAWLVLYLAARHRDATLTGRTFGWRELESLVEGVR